MQHIVVIIIIFFGGCVCDKNSVCKEEYNFRTNVWGVVTTTTSTRV